jgi:hypothetical protein
MENDALRSFASENGGNEEYVRRLKIVRERYEVSRWSVHLSIFSIGVLVGAFIASADNSAATTGSLAPMAPPSVSNVHLSNGDAVLAQPAAAAAITAASSSELQAASSPRAVGTALVRHAFRAVPASPSAPPRRRSSAHRGTLIVNSQPGGANVIVNGRPAGKTPLVMNALPVGSRAVRLTLDGYAPWSRGVSVVANRSTTISAQLNRDRTVDESRGTGLSFVFTETDKDVADSKR